MAWIELHQAVWTHRKTFDLAGRLDISETYAAAHLLRFWCWALDNAPDGSLEGVSDRVIARGADWTGDDATFVAALIESGWLDEDRRIHDWDDYAGRLIERREQNAERMRSARAARAQRKSAPRDEHVRRTFDARAGATGHNTTGPDTTQPDPTEPELLPLDGIEGGAGGSDAAGAANGATAPPPTEGNGKAPKRSRNRTRVPDDFELTERHYEYAATLGIDAPTAESETEKFLAHHRFRATLGVDWYAGWQNWLRDSIGRFAPRPTAARARAPTATHEARDPARYLETRYGSMRGR